MRPDEYVIASSVQEVTDLLRKHGEQGAIIAGGTTIHELSFHRMLVDVRVLIDITELELAYIEATEDLIRIGATTTFTNLLEVAANQYPQELSVVRDALRAVRPMQVRNVATVGGSLCSSLPFFDLPPALLALDAEVEIAGPTERRRVPIEEFSIDYFQPDLGPGELVTEVVIPRRGHLRAGAFRKHETNSVDWASISVAVCLGRHGGRLKDVRVALGGAVGRKVVRARHVEEALEGQQADAATGRRAAALVDRDVTPASDFRASAEYRLEMARLSIERCVETALSRIPD
jgi:aerobic carbon-monoxide dehydrogenase medium subunit